MDCDTRRFVMYGIAQKVKQIRVASTSRGRSSSTPAAASVQVFMTGGRQNPRSRYGLLMSRAIISPGSISLSLEPKSLQSNTPETGTKQTNCRNARQQKK